MSDPADPETRGQFIRMRMLEIRATLAQWKADYFAEGISRPMADRAALEAEHARLKLEERTNSSAAVAAAIERRRKEKADLLGQILAILEEEGLEKIIETAKERAREAA